jgi:hypothetical protein
LSTEVQGLRNENARLKDENEGWEYLVREQTFSNRLFQREPDAEERHKTQLDVLDEEMDEEMDDLHSDLNDQTPTIEHESIFPKSTPTSRQPSRRMNRIASSSTAFSEEPTEGMDLAAEMGRAGVSDVMADGVQEENKRLREEVKALQLYCSKVGSSLNTADTRSSTESLPRMGSNISSMSITRPSGSADLHRSRGEACWMWSR